MCKVLPVSELVPVQGTTCTCTGTCDLNPCFSLAVGGAGEDLEVQDVTALVVVVLDKQNHCFLSHCNN